MADSTNNNNPSRRKFLSLGLLAGAGLITTSASAQSLSESGEKVKMLTQDGKLVEVDMTALTAKKKKITDKELQNWIKK